MIREGQRVAYVGVQVPGGPSLNDEGTMLSCSGDSGHVCWHTGSRQDSYDLVDIADLIEVTTTTARTSGLLEDSLLSPQQAGAVTQEVFATEGAAGLLSMLVHEGRLSSLAQIVADIYTYAEGRVRSDDSMRSILAELDIDDAEALVTMTSSACLRDALLGETDE